MIKLLEKILNFFHLYTSDQVNQKLVNNSAYYDAEIMALRQSAEQTYNSLKDIVSARDQLQARYDEVVSVIGRQNTTIANITAMRDNLDKQLVIANQRLQDMMRREESRLIEVQRYKDAAMMNAEYVKDVQKQLSVVLHGDEMFGFPNKVAIPGSTSIRTDLIEDSASGDHVVVRGRTVLTDDVTQKINNVPDMLSKLELVFSHMDRYGVLTGITKSLIRSGAIAFTLAYNDNCTSYEAYYEVCAKRQDETALMVIDESKKKDAEGN